MGFNGVEKTLYLYWGFSKGVEVKHKMLSHIYLTGVVNARFNFLNLMSFVDGHFETAFELYSHAITLNPNNAVYYGNRSFCSIKLENYGDALTDANKALELDKTYIKVCYRNIGEVLTLGNDLLIESFSKLLFLIYHPIF